MLKDTNLSTILLLGVLLFLIYCLMNQPKQASFFDNKKTKSSVSTGDPNEQFENEDFENESFEDDEEELENEDEDEEELPNEDDEEEYNENFESIEGVNDTENNNYASNVESFADSEISPEVVNQLINESERKSVPVNSPLLKSQGPSESVNNFVSSDDQVYSGASLDAAFERPVADTTNTDVIDLQKNNVKNYNAKDYLPKELNDDWFNTDFSQAKYKMNDDKLINTDKYIIGINTVGQSLKNASYDIRGAVNVPKYSVSPWNNSTIEPDYNIKPLC